MDDEAVYKQLLEIRQELKEIRASCEKMNEHIGFINRTYTHLRTPLDWISNKVNYWRGEDPPPPLPICDS